jgi:glutamate--cysteine ligase
MNFNPAIHIHCFPYEGKNRHLDKALLGVAHIQRLGFV